MAENADADQKSRVASSELLNSSKVLGSVPHGAEWLVAFSGGMDSTVLLHLLANCPNHPPLRAIHVNHQLSPSANAWQQHAESVCAELGIECLSVRVNLENQGRGLEDAGRTARYQVFEQELVSGGILLLGHHQNDQAETMLLRLLRGAGVRGMAAMPARRALGDGELCRPLLESSRSALLGYAKQHALSWIDDDSNADSRFDRNYLRNEVLPLIAARWPAFADNWSFSAAAARETLQLLNDLARQDLPGLDLRSEAYGISADLEAMRELSEARLKNVLRKLLEEHGFSPMPRAQTKELSGSLLAAGADATPLIEWSEHSARRFKSRVYFLYALPMPNEKTYRLVAHEAKQQLVIEGLCRIEFELASSLLGNSDGVNITVHSRRGGERLAAKDAMTKTLKNWFQEHAVPPWMRERLPLIFVDSNLCAVADMWHEHDAIASVKIDWDADRL